LAPRSGKNLLHLLQKKEIRNREQADLTTSGKLSNLVGKDKTMEDNLNALLIFRLDVRLYAIPLHFVQRVVRAAEVTPLADAREPVLGLINMEGEILPVMNMRRCFRVQERDMETSDQMIVAQTAERKVCLWVDDVTEIREVGEQEIVSRERILPDIGQIDGAIPCEDGMVLIYNLDRVLLSPSMSENSL